MPNNSLQSVSFKSTINYVENKSRTTLNSRREYTAATKSRAVDVWTDSTIEYLALPRPCINFPQLFPVPRSVPSSYLRSSTLRHGILLTSPKILRPTASRLTFPSFESPTIMALSATLFVDDQASLIQYLCPSLKQKVAGAYYNNTWTTVNSDTCENGWFEYTFYGTLRLYALSRR